MPDVIPTRRPAQSLCWRVVIAAPPTGFDGQLATMQAWLDATCGADGWATAPAGLGGVANDAVAFCFAEAAAARAFVNRFCCGYKVAS